jgi:hypothetical protein
MTVSRGIGKGNNSGGPNPGAGRPKGAIHHKARDLIAKAEREGLLMPVDLLLSVMRDPAMPLRERLFCATASAPYVHSRLTALRVIPTDVELMDDVVLATHLTKIERHAAKLPAAPVDVAAQLDHLIEDAQQLPYKRQATFFRRRAEASAAGLQALQDRPGAVAPRETMPAAAEPTQEHKPRATMNRPPDPFHAPAGAGGGGGGGGGGHAGV